MKIPPPDKWQRLEAQLAERRAHALYRHRRIADSPAGPEQVIDGRLRLCFCSNDYLGLARHPAVIAAFRQAADDYGVGSGAAHLITGHSRAHHQLEEELAAFTGRERALLFSTGYMANLGVIGALAVRGDWVLEDRLNHASLLDGALLSGARLHRYRHRDADDLAAKLTGAPAATTLIATDGVFSMDGTIAPLPELAARAAARDAWLLVDDAHGFGVLGARGGGCAELFELDQEQVPILMGTLGKAFGTFGAFVAGRAPLIETLIQQARSYVYTTALPPAVAAATRASLKLVQEEGWRREKLQSLISRFRTGAAQLGYTLMDSATPIQPLLVGTSEKALTMSQSLLEHDILISAIRPPTVPEGSARLRITFSAEHSEQQVDRLLLALEAIR